MDPAAHRTAQALLRTGGLVAGICVALAHGACKDREPSAPPAPPPEPPPAPLALDAAQLRAAFPPLPARFDGDRPSSPAMIALGRMLYFETRLSKNHDVSCNTCHDLTRGGVDNLPVSVGHRRQRGDRNAPTVFNAAGHIAQFWDGRALDVEAQATMPVLNSVEMAMSDGAAVVRVLASMPAYVDAFAAAFPGDADPLTYDNLGRAIGAFERGLVTPSRFDAFLAGDDGALTAFEQHGLATFVSSGCTACHGGALLGGGSFQKLGLVEPYPTDDLGRYQVSKHERDRAVFKVPSLRNIADTAPYFHDGSIEQLRDAVATMARIQLARTLTAEEVSMICAFLETLSGAPDPTYIAAPALPASTPATPAPDPT